MQCYTHNQSAVGICRSCSKGLCKECSDTQEKVMLCSDSPWCKEQYQVNNFRLNQSHSMIKTHKIIRFFIGTLALILGVFMLAIDNKYSVLSLMLTIIGFIFVFSMVIEFWIRRRDEKRDKRLQNIKSSR